MILRTLRRDLRESIKMNVVKVNIGADVVRAWMTGCQEGALLDSGGEPPHQVMMQHASKKVSQVARTRLTLMGASNHAKPLLRKVAEERTDLWALTATPLAA
jgi:fructose/tagatose bisphosphate aldolase